MTKLILKDNTYRFLFYLALFLAVFCCPPLALANFLFAFKCLLVLLLTVVILLLVDAYVFEAYFEFNDVYIKVKTMKSEDTLAKKDIETVFVEFNTSAEMKSKIQFIMKNGKTKNYYFTDKCYLSNTYKILENIALFPNFKHEIIGTMPVREIAIDYYLANGKKINFLQSCFATTENFNPVKRYFFLITLILSALSLIFGLILIIVGMFML